MAAPIDSGFAAATPRPWRSVGAALYGPDGYIGEMWADDPESIINARLIVTAVNAFEELVEALALVTGTLIDHAPQEQAVIQRAQLALAKAGAP